MLPRNLNDSTAAIVLSMMVRRVRAGGFLLKSTIISTVLSVFRSRLLWLHKEGKTQKVIAKEAGCSQSSVSKHINKEAKGRKRCGRKK